ncbi:MAG TPA: c-type cytochrome [Steroidobacteraceae bacterium]|nr:c-type cytochrome [Steroidobacteraceae bacterium]
MNCACTPAFRSAAANPHRFGSALLAAYALAAYALAGVPACAAEPGHDALTARGEEIAREVCAACHVVARDQEFPPILIKPAPSFLEIANRPGIDARTIERFVGTTHWDLETIPMRMPSPMLSKSETRAVARYIMTLRTR